MRTTIPPKQRFHRILRRLACYRSELPSDLALEPSEAHLGVLCGLDGSAECFLTDQGVYFHVDRRWARVAYRDIEVLFPAKTNSKGALTLRAPVGSLSPLRGSRELWEVGRFFMRCAEDAKMV